MEATKSLSVLRKRLQELLPILAEEYQVSSLALFGSYIRDGQTPGSDLDLLVEFEEAPSLLRFVELENRLSDELGVEVDLVMRDALKRRIGERILDEMEPL